MEGFYIERKIKRLGKSMHLLVYGSPDAMPVLYFPDETGFCSSANDNGIIDSVAHLIERNKVQIICCDGIDRDAILSRSPDKARRAELQEDYYRAVVEEFLPILYTVNHTNMKTILAGCGIGASQALIAFLRNPVVFSGVVAIGGNYDLKSFFGGWCNDSLYLNSPCDFMRNITRRHRFFKYFPTSSIYICSGKNQANEPGLSSMRELDEIFCIKRISNAHFDYWGYDVTPTYDWYRKMFAYYLPFALEDQYRRIQLYGTGA
ncbi:MAG: hypothetical protein IJ831_09010 [Spirochaetales bacterium]|nr:hypothetical protein [Spirochaetales bacterium]